MSVLQGLPTFPYPPLRPEEVGDELPEGVEEVKHNFT